MKRIIIIILLVLAILLGYQLVVNGVELKSGKVLVSSYEQIESGSDSLVSDIATYNNLNDTQFSTMLTNLNTAISKYKSAKEEYEELVEKYGTLVDDSTSEDEIIYVSPVSVYEIDYLWTTIGNYARTEGITITMDVEKSSISVAEVAGYEYYNLNFSVSGQYIDIADFLYDLEGDDSLGFEIRDFYMVSGAATFTIYSVPIDSETLMAVSESTTITVDGEDGTETSEENETNTVGSDTISSNSTDTANATDSSNTTNTTVD